MTRLQKTALNGSVVVGLYLACLFDLLPLPLSSDTKEAILPVVRPRVLAMSASWSSKLM